MKESIHWGLISKKRDQLFGLSILSIMLFHYVEDVYAHKEMMNLFARGYMPLIGSVGVDVFIFLSGMGLWFSYTKKPEIGSFYKKRALRLLVPYLLWGFLYWGVRDLWIERMGFGTFFLDYSLLSFWIRGNRGLWFIAFMLVCYLIFPILHWVFDRESEFIRGGYVPGLLLLWFWIFRCISRMAPAFYANTEVAWMRLPVFIAGVYVGKLIYEKKAFRGIDIAFLAMGFLWKGWSLAHTAVGVPYLSILPSRILQSWWGIVLTVLGALALWYLKEDSMGDKALLWLGSYSLELYLTHVTIRKVMNLCGYKTRFLLWYLVCMALSVAAAIVLKKLTTAIYSDRKKQG